MRSLSEIETAVKRSGLIESLSQQKDIQSKPGTHTAQAPTLGVEAEEAIQKTETKIPYGTKKYFNTYYPDINSDASIANVKVWSNEQSTTLFDTALIAITQEIRNGFPYASNLLHIGDYHIPVEDPYYISIPLDSIALKYENKLLGKVKNPIGGQTKKVVIIKENSIEKINGNPNLIIVANTTLDAFGDVEVVIDTIPPTITPPTAVPPVVPPTGGLPPSVTTPLVNAGVSTVLNNILGGDGIKRLTSDTQNLMKQQMQLAEAMKGMTPLMEGIAPMVANLKGMMGQMGDGKEGLGSILDLAKKFSLQTS